MKTEETVELSHKYLIAGWVMMIFLIVFGFILGRKKFRSN